ncbi:transcription factor jumonji, partial [Ascobolus immersus RN42]
EKYKGIHTPYLYFGTPGTVFTWHLEDWLLPSANHLISGASKLWYLIPAASLTGFENACKENEYDTIRFQCPQFIKHERLFFSGKRVSSSPNDWEENGYKCYTVEQEVGHLIVIWPGVYHSGINMGYNLAEAANFAIGGWLK